jgi:molybdate transport system substrate-binding protein
VIVGESWAGPPPSSTSGAEPVHLLVYSGAGFRLPIEDAARAFEERSGVRIEATFAGSGCLLAQAELAGRGDVFIPGELHYLEQAQKRGIAGEAVHIAYLRPVIVVAKGNPSRVAGLADLARPGLRVGLGDPQSVAVGIAAERWLAAELDEGTRAAVLERVTTRALNVNELGSQLTLGALDAAIVWDATAPLFPGLVVIAPASSLEHRTLITGSVLTMSKHPEQAARFLAFLVGEEGRSIFRERGYAPVEPQDAAGMADRAAAPVSADRAGAAPIHASGATAAGSR